MPKKKLQRNPYLIMLLKRLLQYEFVKTDSEPTDLGIACYLYDRHKSGKYLTTSYNDKAKDRDSFAFSKAERIYRQVFCSETFEFTSDMLDFVVEELSAIESFKSWEEFEARFGNQRGANVCNRRYFGKALTQNELQTVLSMANMTLSKLHFSKLRCDKPNNHLVMADDDDLEFTIRTANTEDIRDIEALARRVYPCSINDFSIKKPWHDKNRNIFFVFRDNYDLWGNINLLPLKQNFFDDLKSGKRYENEITSEDIYSIEEKGSVNIIYIEGLACTLSRVLKLFSIHFKKMLSCLSNVNNENLVLCAIGGSAEGDLLMKNCGFKQTGISIDPKDNSEYPFLEIKWKRLEKTLSKSDKYSCHLGEDKRLTANIKIII